MLILTRKAGEAIWVGEDIRVLVYQIRGDKSVRIGIEAPDDVGIVREDLYTTDSLNDAFDAACSAE